VSRTGALAFALVAACLAVLTGPAPAAGFLEGTHEGADFLIAVPARWNGGLVMFAHGYEGEGDGRGSVRASPLSSQLEARGYAWAASGYRSRGYRPDWFMADMLALRAHFITRFGAPRWTILHGQSMGGHVTIASLELHPEVYQGGLIECGIVDGVGLIDWLYAYSTAAEYLSGVRLLDAPDRQAFAALVNGPWLDAMGTPGSYTERGRRFDSVVKHLMGGELPLRLEGMRQRYIMNLSSRDPGPDRAQEFARHASTTHIRYRIDPGLGVTEEELNRGIRRITPAPGARSREGNPVFAELTGKIRAPLMTITRPRTSGSRSGCSRTTAAAPWPPAPRTCSCSARCAGPGTAPSTAPCASGRSTTWWSGWSAASSPRATTCSPPTSRGSACASRPRCIPWIPWHPPRAERAPRRHPRKGDRRWRSTSRCCRRSSSSSTTTRRAS